MPTKKVSKLPIIHKSKRRQTFLTIPGELRNKIYECHYETIFVVELISKHSTGQISGAYQFMKNDEHDQPNPKLRCDRQLGKYQRVNGLKTRWETSISALHLASKQIHRECIQLLYGSVTIFTQSSNRLANFLSVVSKTNLKCITRLHLDHQTYGSPELLEDVIWKEKHDRKWALTCINAAKSMPNLQELHVNLDIRDVPLRFSLYERWILPLYPFTIHCKALEDVRIRIFTPELAKTYLNTKDANTWTGYYPWYIQALVEQHKACKEMHRLFGEAVATKMKGMSDEEAMEEYREACKEKHGAWQFATNFEEHYGVGS